MLSIGGCAAPGPDIPTRSVQSQESPPWPGNQYSPKLPSGIETLDAAKKDLPKVLQTRTLDEGAGVRFSGKLDFNRPENQKNLIEYLKFVQVYMLIHDAKGEFKYMLPRGGITLLEDRINVNPAFTLFYADLLDTQIKVEKRDDEIRYSWPDVNWKIVNETLVGKGIAAQYRPLYQRPYRIQCGDLVSFFFKKQTDAERFADDLFFIQRTLKKQNDDRHAGFESRAAEYRKLSVKPPISEEQRKLIVQANALNQEKKHTKAIDHYLRAVDLDPVSYPAAYFNLALLSAQVNRFKVAISYMKQYLLLEPDAKDARSAQDKIYEWELKVQEGAQ